jgi:hypothetical protein
MNPSAYYTSYGRALHNYAVSGFFARDLDADDHAFLERVRERRCMPVGSLADTVPTACTYSDDVIHRVALVEEFEFWQQPYQIDQIAVRRYGPVPRPPQRLAGATPNAERMKRNRELLAQARAEEERRLEERRVEQLRRDIEWEKAKPKLVSRKFGRVHHRHYVPQWKVDEEEESGRKAFLKHSDETRRARKQKIREELEAQERSRQQHEARQQQRLEAYRRTIEARREAEDASLTGFERAQRITDAIVKSRIIEIMQMMSPRLVTLEELMRDTGQAKEVIMRCAEQLMREGRLVQRGTSP